MTADLFLLISYPLKDWKFVEKARRYFFFVYRLKWEEFLNFHFFYINRNNDKRMLEEPMRTMNFSVFLPKIENIKDIRFARIRFFWV
jgi:hypothetical protein